MPTSNIGSFENGLRMILEINPESILDVGPGFGTWAFLSRMYLDMRRDAVWKDVSSPSWSRRIEGVEAFPGYARSPLLGNLYDKIHVMTASEFFEVNEESYDLVILSHVLEHMPKADGLFVLNRALATCGNVIVGLPLDCSTEDREPFFENEHERHCSDWAEDIQRLREMAHVSVLEEGTNLLAWIPGKKYVEKTPAGWVSKYREPVYQQGK